MNKVIAQLLGLTLTAFALWSLLTPFPIVERLINHLDQLGYDLELRARVLTQNESPDNKIVIVDVDDKSVKAEGQWPWSRDKLTLLINNLNRAEVSVIAFDLFFSEPKGIYYILSKKGVVARGKLYFENYSSFPILQMANAYL